MLSTVEKCEQKAGQFLMGQRVRKKAGADWQGRVVGWYSTVLTPQGYAIESEFHPGSVQIYPVSALEPMDDLVDR